MFDPQQEPAKQRNARQTFDALVGIMTVLAFPVVLWTTKLGTWGHRYLGFHALLGFLWPFVFASALPPSPGRGVMMIFWFVSMVVLAMHLAQAGVRRRQGYRCHSQFWGESLFQRGHDIRAQRSARTAANFVVLLLAIACCNMPSDALGVFLIVGVVGKAFTESLTFQAMTTRLRQIEDARVENAYYFELHRQRMGE